MSSKRRHSSKHGPQGSGIQPAAPESMAPAPSPTPPPPPRPAHDADRIGDILRRVREHRGEDIESISNDLRIRPNYLVALENSRYQDLPADAYVIGFLRTYAVYLGLDGRGAIEQYRREMAGRRHKPQLSMPQPMSEGRAPTAAVLIAAAVAALLVYALWYALSTPNSADMAATPTRLETLPETAKTLVPVETTTPAPVDGAVPVVPAQPSDANAGVGIPVSAPAPATTEIKAEPPKEVDAASPPKDAKENKESKDLKEKEKIKAPEKPAEPPTPQTQGTQEPAALKAETFGETGKARLRITAKEESWVLITDNKGLTVFDRTLKAGESYNVPSSKGLNLTTGNASGISFTLDGGELPKLGASGRVVRALSLDPEKLKARLNASTSAAVQPSAAPVKTDAQAGD